MTLSTTTIIVVTANFLTAVVAALLLMLVAWQAPRQRYNQLFAFAMLMLMGYSIANAFGRFIDTLHLDPAHATYTAITIYALFVVTMFFFASEFAQSRTRTTRAMRIFGLMLVATQIWFLWTGDLFTNLRPTESNDGGYQGDWTTFGIIIVGLVIAYLVASSVVLYKMNDARGRSLWPAPLMVITQTAWSTLVWPFLPIPLAAIFLALAALAMGLPVLRYQLFNPLAQAHAELAEKNQELETSNTMKSMFLSSMSHELRTPLNSIIGYTQLVSNGTYGALNDTQRDRLEKVIRNGYNLLGLINDVLDLSRIESGRVSLELAELDTPALLESALSTIEPLAMQKGLAIRREFAAAPPTYADETRARQILTNILANAVKFTDQGSITIRAYARDGMIQYEIADTGIGIPREHFDAVFAEFQQLDGSSTRRHKGTGLGLAITRRLVEIHGGSIWLESEIGQGTTFFLTLPAAATVASISGSAAQARRAAQGRTVLVIDDNPDARQLVADMLHSAGYHVITADNGPVGLTRARADHPDLIALDVLMPGMDGWQVLRALKDNPLTCNIPVIIVSIVDEHPLAIHLGAHNALVKPLDRARLLTVVDTILARRPMTEPVLVVDDEEEDRAMILETLGQQGYAVECVADGSAALDWLAGNVPGLIVLDLVLREVSGFDVLASVRAEERLAHVPVVVVAEQTLSAETQDFLRGRCVALVNQGYARSGALLEAVQKALAASPLPSQVAAPRNH